jgi:hypothetical protein
MGITITAIQLIGGVGHRHVAALRWVSDDAGASGDSSARAVIDWLTSDDANVAWVGNPDRLATLQVVTDSAGSHLQANRVGAFTRDLLELPRLPLYCDLRITDMDEPGVSPLADAVIGQDDIRERRIDPDAASLP